MLYFMLFCYSCLPNFYSKSFINKYNKSLVINYNKKIYIGVSFIYCKFLKNKI